MEHLLAGCIPGHAGLPAQTRDCPTNESIAANFSAGAAQSSTYWKAGLRISESPFPVGCLLRLQHTHVSTSVLGQRMRMRARETRVHACSRACATVTRVPSPTLMPTDDKFLHTRSSFWFGLRSCGLFGQHRLRSTAVTVTLQIASRQRLRASPWTSVPGAGSAVAPPAACASPCAPPAFAGSPTRAGLLCPQPISTRAGCSLLRRDGAPHAKIGSPYTSRRGGAAACATGRVRPDRWLPAALRCPAAPRQTVCGPPASGRRWLSPDVQIWPYKSANAER